MYKTIIRWVVLLIGVGYLFQPLHAQPNRDVSVAKPNNTLSTIDSISYSSDSLSDSLLSKSDSLLSNEKDTLKNSSAITDVLSYSSKDSVYVDMKTGIAYLYSEAKVDYIGSKLEADYMEIDMNKSEVLAKPTIDSTGENIGIPHFTDASNTFDAKEIKYNFHTKRGLIKEVTTQEQEIYVHGQVVKKYENDVSFIKKAQFTSCDLEHPHFDIRAFKAKVIPHDKIVMGAAMMFIENIPTPLVIPFAVLPNSTKRKSGILIPTVGQTQRDGFFFRGLGYYFRFNDYVDLKIDGDAYTGGNWEVRGNLRYALRYKFSGGLGFAYSQNFQGIRGDPNRAKRTGISVQWAHNQDAKAHPNSRFSANVNYTNSAYSQYANNINDYLTNTTTSNISYSIDFAKKLHLTLNGAASYNTNTSTMEIILPTINFTVDQLYPFRRKHAIGKRKWYETISFNYNLLAQNTISAPDTMLFTKKTLDEMKNGIQQNATLSSTVKIFKYINWTNSFVYHEYWYTKNIKKEYAGDTLKTINQNGFKTTRDFSYNTNINFKLYGILRFKKGAIKAFRHVLTPSVGFTYRPDFSTPFWNSYETYTDPNGVVHQYSKYANSLYGGPPSGMVGSVNFSLNNTFDMKVRNRKDTANPEKNISLLDYFSISTSYNMAADSLRWAPITLSARTVLFQRLNIQVGASFDFYKIDSNGQRYNEFFWINNKYKTLRFSRTDLAISLSWSLNPKAKPKADNTNNPSPYPFHSYASPMYDESDLLWQPIDFNVPWNLNLGYNLNYIVTPNPKTNKLQHDVVQTITLTGSISITPKWQISFGTGFDIMAKKFTITTINFSRDLHCWEMGFYWIPFGTSTEWNFHIRIKSSIFQDIKYEKRKDFRDNEYY
ncbi:MAG: putative LPS assembly protein LptD [Bacteroidales bacterium]